jgi:CRISPR-associated endonuclease/helicase Cas3
MGSSEEYGDSWRRVQRELIAFAEMISGLSLKDLEQRQFSYVMPQCETLLTGIVIMADWIASNTDYFPLVPLLRQSSESREWQESEEILDPSLLRVHTVGELAKRAEAAWERVDITPAWEEESDLPESVEELFSQRFHLPEGAHPRPVQSAAVNVMKQVENPGIVVIEAPMGEGKTEAALAAAEILARKTGRGGVCVALPTMATTDAMFDRAADWVNALPQASGMNEKSIYLAHGKAALNERFQGIVSVSRHQREHGFSIYDEHEIGEWHEAKPEAIAADWFWGRKRGVLANFLVCTVDQVLMSSLQMRHVVLRQLAIANKVVVIDECHAYDIYMRQYLLRTLEWLGGMGTPVILLSATLPEELRTQMVNSYLAGRKAKPRKHQQGSFLARMKAAKKSVLQTTVGTGRVIGQQVEELTSASATAAASIDSEYPLITYSDGEQIKRQMASASSRETTVECSFLLDDLDSMLKLVNRLLKGGGCIGIICDVVTRAQEVASVMEQHFGSDIVKLVHSRFIDIDRMNNESDLRTLLGPPTPGGVPRPEKLIVVGTQVLEQSLDVDFDALITDVAPVDLMLQRMGRLHRHARGVGESLRPRAVRTARCYIRGIDEWQQSGPVFSKGVDYVYYSAALIEALAVLNMTSEDVKRTIHLPADIAPLVRTAYSSKVVSLVDSRWEERYGKACEERSEKDEAKQQKSRTFLMQSLGDMVRDRRCLGDDEQVSMGNINDEKGQRAVRDTEDTIEVILLQKRGGGIGLLPWLNEGAQGGGLSVDVSPSEQVAKIAAQCSVRLPAWMGRGSLGDDIVASLENLSEPYVTQWQDSKWLAGKLIVPLDDDLSAAVSGWRLTYSERKGLFVEKAVDSEDLE